MVHCVIVSYCILTLKSFLQVNGDGIQKINASDLMVAFAQLILYLSH